MRTIVEHSYRLLINLNTKRKLKCHISTCFVTPTLPLEDNFFRNLLSTLLIITFFYYSSFILMNIKALLGDALSTLTEQMGIDMKSELMSNPQSMKDVQV